MATALINLGASLIGKLISGTPKVTGGAIPMTQDQLNRALPAILASRAAHGTLTVEGVVSHGATLTGFSTPASVSPESAAAGAAVLANAGFTPDVAPAPYVAPAPLVSPLLARPQVVGADVGGFTQASLGGIDMSFLSGLGKVLGGVATAATPILSSIGSIIHPAATAAGRAATTAIDATAAAGRVAGRTIAKHPVLAAAGAASLAGAGMAGAAASGAMHPAVAKHIRKALGLHHRRMHVTNTRALHRALRRVKGFERVARRVLQITHHKPVKVHFKFRRHKRAA